MRRIVLMVLVAMVVGCARDRSLPAGPLAASTIILEFAHPQKDAWRGLRRAAELTADVARAAGGSIVDLETRETFTLPEWERRRLAPWPEGVPDVSDHITIHFYQQGEFTDETRIVEHGADVLEVSRKARERLPELRSAFNAGLAPGELILLKAPFPTDGGGREWMWVEVARWNGDAIRGTLRNEPDGIRGLHAGQMVDVRESDVFAYSRRRPDGSQEGNTTAAVLSR